MLSYLEHADEESHADDLAVRLDPCEADSEYSPAEQEESKPQGWPNVAFHDPVAGDFEDGVGHTICKTSATQSSP